MSFPLKLVLECFSRGRESIVCRNSRTPACAGVTEFELLEVPISYTQQPAKIKGHQPCPPHKTKPAAKNSGLKYDI
jgi:hypothetical protein